MTAKTARKPVTTRKATRSELRPGTGREKAEARAARRNRKSTTNQREGTMPTRTRKPKAKAAPAKAEATKAAPAKSNGAAAKPAFTLNKTQAKAIAKRLRDGDTMKEIREEFGHSDGSKVRAALREHGFGSKGQDNPEGLTPTEWRAKYGTEENGNGASKPAAKRTRTKAKAAEAEAEAEAEDEEEAEEGATEETPDERRKRLRKARREAKKAEAAKPARKRSRKPKATAADPS